MFFKKIKDVYGKEVMPTKKYQEGGNIQYNLSDIQNPLQQKLLTQLGQYGYDIDPRKDIISQMQGFNMSSQDIADMFRSKYSIGSKVEMPLSMFSEINPSQLKALDTEFYNPLREKTYSQLSDKFLQQKQNINTGGFAGSGQAIQKEDDLRDAMGIGIEQGEMNIDKLISSAYGNILGEMQNWEQAVSKLRFG